MQAAIPFCHGSSRWRPAWGAELRGAGRRAGWDMTQFGPLGLVVLDCCAPSDFLEPDALGGLLFGVVALATLGVSILQRRHGDAASPRLLPVLRWRARSVPSSRSPSRRHWERKTTSARTVHSPCRSVRDEDGRAREHRGQHVTIRAPRSCTLRPGSPDQHDDPRCRWAGCARGGRAVARPRAHNLGRRFAPQHARRAAGSSPGGRMAAVSPADAVGGRNTDRILNRRFSHPAHNPIPKRLEQKSTPNWGYTIGPDPPTKGR